MTVTDDRMLHPAPVPRKSVVAKRGVLLRKKIDCSIEFRYPTLTCRRDSHKDTVWTVNISRCKVTAGKGANELVIRQDKLAKSLLFESVETFKQWYEALQYASRWSFDEFYELQDSLGAGGFAKVYKCKEKSTERQFACKVIDLRELNNQEKDLALREIQVLTELRGNRYFPEIFDVFHTEDELRIVLEFVSGGDLFTYLQERKKLTESETKKVMVQLLEALDALHSHNFMHRDLKPENIMLIGSEERLKIKIIDFGLSDHIQGTSQAPFKAAGTTGYMAPEIVVGERHGASVDIWACGCIMYALLCGKLPFNVLGKDGRNTMLRSTQATLKFQGDEWESVSVSAKSLIQLMLKLQPFKRPSARVALEHGWFGEHQLATLQVQARTRLHQYVHAMMFLFSYHVEKTSTKQSFVSLKSAINNIGDVRSVTNIFASNATRAE